MIKFFITIFLLIILGIFFFEALASSDCAKNFYKPENPCVDLLVQEYGRELNQKELDVYYNFLKTSGVDKIEKSKVSEIIQSKTRILPRYKINGANGISCGLMNFIANDMSVEATQYVSTREALYMLGIKNETKTNYKAAIMEPVGFVETVFHSIFANIGFPKLEGVPCKVGRMWNSFKLFLSINNVRN